MKMYYFYDKEADVFYFSQGKPSARDISQETHDDVIVRIHPKTRRPRGFTILNASRRLHNRRMAAVTLPMSMELSML